MSGKNNVNPDHYKVAGRDKPNERIPPQRIVHRPELGRRNGAVSNFIPGVPIGKARVGGRPRRPSTLGTDGTGAEP